MRGRNLNAVTLQFARHHSSLQSAVLVLDGQQRRRALAPCLQRSQHIAIVALRDIAHPDDVLCLKDRVIVRGQDPLHFLVAQRVRQHTVNALRPEHADMPSQVDSKRLGGDCRAVHVVRESKSWAGLH